MDWLKEHSYLASWISPCVAIVIALIVNWRKSAEKIDWFRVALLFVFMLSIPIAITPVFDQDARSFGRLMFFTALGALAGSKVSRGQA